MRFNTEVPAPVNFIIQELEKYQQYKRLENVSIERINSEFCKIVASENFCVELLQYSDVFSLFIPELKDLIGFQQNNPYHAYDVFDHTIHAIEQCESDDLVVRLAVFFHDFGKPHSYQDGELENNRDDLLYWMKGVADGGIKL